MVKKSSELPLESPLTRKKGSPLKKLENFQNSSTEQHTAVGLVEKKLERGNSMTKGVGRKPTFLLSTQLM